jgi:GT2 family glycosyltransferase
MMADKFPKVSLVMLAWNRKESVLEGLAHIYRSTYPNFEVILVDNGSSDSTSEVVAEEYPNVKLVTLPQNIGIAGYNNGFNCAEGDYVVVLDDDSYPAVNALERMVARFEQDSEIGIIAFRIEHLITHVVQTKHWPEISTRMIGCGAGIRSATLQTVGYYDADFFLYTNDYDLAVRVWNAGQRVIYDHSIVAYHAFAQKNRSNGRAIFYATRNGIWFDFKHLPFPMLLLGLLRHIFGSFARAVAKRAVQSYLLGLGAGFLNLHVALAKRKPVQREVATFLLQNHVFYEPIHARLNRVLRKQTYEDFHYKPMATIYEPKIAR